MMHKVFRLGVQNQQRSNIRCVDGDGVDMGLQH